MSFDPVVFSVRHAEKQMEKACAYIMARTEQALGIALGRLPDIEDIDDRELRDALKDMMAPADSKAEAAKESAPKREKKLRGRRGPYKHKPPGYSQRCNYRDRYYPEPNPGKVREDDRWLDGYWQIADYLNVSPKLIKKWIDYFRFPHYRLGRQVCALVSEVEAWRRRNPDPTRLRKNHEDFQWYDLNRDAIDRPPRKRGRPRKSGAREG